VCESIYATSEVAWPGGPLGGPPEAVGRSGDEGHARPLARGTLARRRDCAVSAHHLGECCAWAELHLLARGDQDRVAVSGVACPVSVGGDGLEGAESGHGDGVPADDASDQSVQYDVQGRRCLRFGDAAIGCDLVDQLLLVQGGPLGCGAFAFGEGAYASLGPF